MTSIPASATGVGRALHSPAGAFTSVLSAAVGIAAAKLERQVVAWADKLTGGAGAGDRPADLAPLVDAGVDALAEGRGATEKAGAEGIKAALHGTNPIWAAIKGAWRSGTPAVRAAIITAAVAAVLLLLISPVLLVVFLLCLLIIAALHRTGAAKA